MAWVELFCRFAAVAPPEGESHEPLESQLGELLAAAAVAWPTLGVPAASFVQYLAERTPAGGGAATLATLHASDLYVACACLRGDAAALRILEEQWLAPLEPALRRLVGAAQGADALQLLRERLLLGDGDHAPRLGEYAGRGPLARWLRVAAMRTALNQRRGERELPASEAELVTMGPAGRDLEFDYIQARFREDFREAFVAAFAALDKRQRSLLRFHYGDGLTIEQVAQIHRVSRATMARWLAAARADLLAGTRREIAERHDLRASQVESLMRLLGSHVDVSLSAILLRRP
jgi:RNA polymerase sigma-70 factor (ECF subfamily)